jgi:hypothetical protein
MATDIGDLNWFHETFPALNACEETPQGMRSTRDKAARSTVFFYPDFEETVASFQPSAPDFDRIC